VTSSFFAKKKGSTETPFNSFGLSEWSEWEDMSEIYGIFE